MVDRNIKDVLIRENERQTRTPYPFPPKISHPYKMNPIKTGFRMYFMVNWVMAVITMDLFIFALGSFFLFPPDSFPVFPETRNFNIWFYLNLLHSHYNWINDCNKKEMSHWKLYRSTRSQKSGQFLAKFCFSWSCNLFLGFQSLSKGVRSITNKHYKKICDSFDWNCSF